MLNKLTIKKKIIFIILVVTITSVGLAFAIDILLSINNFRKNMQSSLSMNSRLIAEYCITPLVFEDKEGAGEIIKTLSKISDVVYGQLYDNEGKVYAEYFKDSHFNMTELDQKNRDFEGYDGKYLILYEPVIFKDIKYGNVKIIASTESLRHDIIQYLLSRIFILVLLIIMATVLAIWLQKIISKPVLDLASFTEDIYNTENYSVRIQKNTKDEIGFLYDSFNNMLQKIEQRQVERDNALDDLMQERKSLEKHVKKRTAELQKAKEKAEESDRLKTSFLANMSHEIRTPLNAIIGFSSIIADEEITNEQRREFLEMINSSGDDLLNLINDILDISKIEANQLNIYKEKHLIKSIISEVFEVLKQSLIDEGKDGQVMPIKLIPEKLIDYKVSTDNLRLKQILNNIVYNAIKFTDKGSITVGYEVDEQKKLVVIFVKDTGIGIPNEQLENIFNRFTKIEENKTRLYSGTGLGLYIVNKLVDLLDGKIWVKSELGKGSKFFISIPYLEKNENTNKVGISGNTNISIDLLGKTILVVEDVEDNFVLLKILLEKYAQAKILWAQSGNEAIKFCRETAEIDLILMDIQLPDINGLETVKIIKTMREEIPVIMQTAYVMENEREQSLAMGCNDFITKPIEKEILLKKIALIFQTCEAIKNRIN